jgi:Fe2+ transport system protein B
MAMRVLQTRATRMALLIMLLLFEVPAQLALILVVLGLFPDLEPALYLTAVVLLLFQGAGLLVMLVYSQGRAQTASSPAS